MTEPRRGDTVTPNPILTRLRQAGVSICPTRRSSRKAITGSDLYDGELRQLADGGVRDLQEAFFALALDDVRDAARALRGSFDRARGHDGYVSFECTPDLADDTDATIAQAIDLWQRLDQPNVMIMVPGTVAGLPAIEELTRRGVNVNVTLLFSVERCLPDRRFAAGWRSRVLESRTRVDLASVTAGLERAGVRSFCDSYRQLLDCIEEKLVAVAQ
jgi:transaldolase